MASLSPGGVPLPLDAAGDERVLDPANAGIAVQNHGYWASVYVTIARAFAPVDTPLHGAREGARRRGRRTRGSAKRGASAGGRRCKRDRIVAG